MNPSSVLSSFRPLFRPTATFAFVAFLVIQLSPFAFPQQQYPQTYQRTVQKTTDRGQSQHGPNAQENVLIILDASYSMIENLDGDRTRSGEDTKMIIAKRTILEVLKNVPSHVNVGLRVYGQERSRRTSKACRATQTLVPIGSNNRHQVANALIKLKPTGMTPISYSLNQAINQDFYNLPGKKSIILVSDGMETCDADPCSVSVDMVRHNVDVRINVVGFGIHDLAATRQLKCVALSTFGKYYSANTAADLAESLKNSLNVQTSVQGQIVQP